MFCEFPTPVFLNDFTDLFHSIDDEHMGVSQVVFLTVSVLGQNGIIPCVERVDGIQKARQMVVDGPPPDKCVSVCVCLDLGPIDVKLFQGDKMLFFKTTYELVIQFIQDFSRQLLSLKVIKSISFGFLSFGQPDKSEISLAQFNDPVNRPDPQHICVSHNRIQHDRIIPGSSLI